MDYPTRIPVVLGTPAVLVIVALAACTGAPAVLAGEKQNGAETDRSVAVGMWGTDDGWSIATGMRLGAAEAESRSRKAGVAEADISLAGTHG